MIFKYKSHISLQRENKVRGAEVQSLKAQVGIFINKVEFFLVQLQMFVGKCLIFRLQGYWNGGERASIESPRGDQQEVSEITDYVQILIKIDPIHTMYSN